MLNESLNAMTKNDVTPANDNGDRRIRSPYQSPKLARLGPIHSLVQVGHCGAPDGAHHDGDGAS